MPLFEVSGLIWGSKETSKKKMTVVDNLTVTWLLRGFILCFWTLGVFWLTDGTWTVEKWLESWQRVKIQERKEKIIDSYRLSRRWYSTTFLYCYSKMPRPLFWEYAPELFVEEQQAVNWERQRQALCCIRNGRVNGRKTITQSEGGSNGTWWIEGHDWRLIAFRKKRKEVENPGQRNIRPSEERDHSVCEYRTSIGSASASRLLLVLQLARNCLMLDVFNADSSSSVYEPNQATDGRDSIFKIQW